MIIMKFGGTSVQDATSMTAVIEIVRTKVPKNPLVVTSAISGATNILLQAPRLAIQGEKQKALDNLVLLRERHWSIAEKIVREEYHQNLRDFITATFEKLVNLIEGISLLGELTPRSQDLFAAQGELLSSKILVAAMKTAGLNSEWFDARTIMRTDNQFGSATPLMNEIRVASEKNLRPLLSTKTVVTQGFIGSTKDGITTTLGRGGSDYSAAILGAALDAEDIEIWTDVDGVLTTDPRLVKNAKRVRQMTFQEASELAYFGAKVLHPATIIPAVEKNIPVHVYNTKNPASGGTLIANSSKSAHGLIKSIAYKKNITIVNIVSTRMLLAHGFLASIFDVFKKHQTGVDVVSTTEVSVSLTIEQTNELEDILRDLRLFAQVQVESERGIVCLVGEQIHDSPGIAARTFAAIRDVNINMISQGASEINLTFVIAQEDVDRVVKILHDEFFSGPLPPELFE